MIVNDLSKTLRPREIQVMKMRRKMILFFEISPVMDIGNKTCPDLEIQLVKRSPIER